jgi:DNA-binding MarR family transcriptional regulator
MDALQEAIGIHPREFGVLSVLAENEGKTQHALGEAANVDPSTMVATLDALEARGFAERRVHPNDRRKRAVHLTDAGREALAAGQRVAAEVGKRSFSALDAGERKELNRLLRKLSGVPR